MENIKSEFSNIDFADENEKKEEYSNMDDILTDESNNYFIEIKIGDTQKVGEGFNSYLTFSLMTKTNFPKFKKIEFTTHRRFSDFLGLHDLLVAKYLRNGKIIPMAPSKNIIGSTKVKISPQQVEANGNPNPEWLEIRRVALERFINRTAQHPVLRQDLDFINFLESDKELPRAINTSTLSGATVMKFFNKFGETVNKITYKMDENDPWFDEKITEIENMDITLQNLHSAIRTLVNDRKELSSFTGLVSKAAALLSTCEGHTGLSRGLSVLADIQEKIEILRSEQANSDFFILSEFIKDYLGLLDAIKAVFHERVKVFQNWQHAQMQLTKKREIKARLELSGRNEKYDAAQKEIEEWEYKVQRCQDEFHKISNEIKEEINRFNEIRSNDFEETMKKYFENQMAHQQQLIKCWEAFIPITKEIF